MALMSKKSKPKIILINDFSSLLEYSNMMNFSYLNKNNFFFILDKWKSYGFFHERFNKVFY